MILYERVSWLSMVVRVQGSVVSRIWPRFVLTTAISIGFWWLQQRHPSLRFSLTVTPFVITGLPLGIILGFRNSSSYERFWDGRKLWGALVNASRSFMRQLDAYVAVGAANDPEVLAWKRATAHRLIAFAYALCAHLRRERDTETLRPLLAEGEADALVAEGSPPAALLHRLGADLRVALEKNWINPLHAPMLEASLVTLTDVVGGCERIKNTPTPISYLIFIHRAVALYCFLLPFGLVDTVRGLTPLVVFFVSYALFSLDAIGDELDDPFRVGQNTLPIASIARNVDIYLRRRLGETKLPEPLPAIDGVLR